MYLSLIHISSGDDRYTDSTALFNYGFNNFRKITVSPDKVENKTVDILNGDYKIATARIYLEEEQEFWLHNEIEDSSVIYETTTPQSFNEKAYEPLLRITLMNNEYMLSLIHI